LQPADRWPAIDGETTAAAAMSATPVAARRALKAAAIGDTARTNGIVRTEA